MARLGSARPFVLLCSFKSFDVAESRKAAASELARRGGGPLGLVRSSEIVLSARDLAAERQRWQRLLDPVRPNELGAWALAAGPALRLVEGNEDAIQAVVWEVSSLDQAADWLTAKGWLGATHDNGVSIARDPLQGLDVRLAPDTSPSS